MIYLENSDQNFYYIVGILEMLPGTTPFGGSSGPKQFKKANVFDVNKPQSSRERTGLIFSLLLYTGDLNIIVYILMQLLLLAVP